MSLRFNKIWKIRKPGTRISLDYFDSLQVLVTEAFSSYPEEQQLLDLANAMTEK